MNQFFAWRWWLVKINIVIFGITSVTVFIWNKVSEPDCEPVYNVKFLKLYPHVLSKEFKYSEKEKKAIHYITNKLKLSSGYFD